MLKDKSLEAYANELYSDSHVGGGGVAALNAALGSALVGMVANLTKDKEGYAEVSTEMKEILALMDKVKDVFIAFIDQDAKAFNGVLSAFKLPKNTEDEKEIRRLAIQHGYKEAIAVPLALAKSAAEIFDSVEIVLEKGNKNIYSDGLAAAICLRSCILISLLNVETNLSAVKDEAYVQRIKKEVAELRTLANQKEQQLISKK